MRETYLNRKRKERTAHWRILNRKRIRVQGTVLSYRDQQQVDADFRALYCAMRQNYLSGAVDE